MGEGRERYWGGNGHTPMGLRYRDDQTEGRVGRHSNVEVRSSPLRQHDTDCPLHQRVHIEMVALAEGRRAVPACSVEVQVATVFGLEDVQDQD